MNRKLVSVFLASLILLLGISSVYAESKYSQYSDEELSTMLQEIQAEIRGRQTSKASPETDFLYASSGTEIEIRKYLGSDSEVVIPDEIDGVPVTRIGYQAFYKNETLEHVVFPKGLQIIGEGAFESYHLSGVLDLPPTVKKIGAEAFQCTDYEGIIINSSFVGDGWYRFNIIYELKFVYIREGANPKWGGKDFYSSPALEIAIIPESVKTFPDDLFEKCPLVKIITPAGSAAEQFAKKNFIPVETDTYDAYVAEYEALYPNPW